MWADDLCSGWRKEIWNSLHTSEKFCILHKCKKSHNFNLIAKRKWKQSCWYNVSVLPLEAKPMLTVHLQIRSKKWKQKFHPKQNQTITATQRYGQVNCSLLTKESQEGCREIQSVVGLMLSASELILTKRVHELTVNSQRVTLLSLNRRSTYRLGRKEMLKLICVVAVGCYLQITEIISEMDSSVYSLLGNMSRDYFKLLHFHPQKSTVSCFFTT